MAQISLQALSSYQAKLLLVSSKQQAVQRNQTVQVQAKRSNIAVLEFYVDASL